MQTDNFLWTERHRPRTVAATILPPDLKARFQQFVDKKNVPNLLLCGKAGVGKTTVARAMLEELGCEYIVINGSMEGGIDTLRTLVSRFASSVSLEGGRKYVILDEADYLSNFMQPALRNFMEEYSKNCGFILTCNYKNKIIKPLQSRCSVVEFDISDPEQKPALAKEFMKNVMHILDYEKVIYDPKILPPLITKFFPDFRRVINELQFYSASGKIDSGILSNVKEIQLKSLVKLMKEKNFTGVRKWVAENSNMDSTEFYRMFYDHVDQYVKPKDIPFLVLLISKYSYQDPLCLDREINTAAFLAEVIANCDFV